jgi:glutamyl-tRNA synthetase
VRIHVPIETKVAVSDSHIPLCREMGDFVLWRRGGLPAYQLASLVDDLDYRITLIVRGRDLLDSTAAQLFLAQQLGQDDFRQTTFIHHPLISCAEGKKLSKSHGSLSLKAMREGGASVTEIYRLTARQLGIEPKEIVGLSDLMAAHRERLGPGDGENHRQGETS